MKNNRNNRDNRNTQSLNLNKKSVSALNREAVNGGAADSNMGQISKDVTCHTKHFPCEIK